MRISNHAPGLEGCAPLRRLWVGGSGLGLAENSWRSTNGLGNVFESSLAAGDPDSEVAQTSQVLRYVSDKCPTTVFFIGEFVHFMQTSWSGIRSQSSPIPKLILSRLSSRLEIPNLALQTTFSHLIDQFSNCFQNIRIQCLGIIVISNK